MTCPANVDGKNFMAVFEAAGRAIDRARQGDGPTLIECKTYRNYGHFEGDQQTYKYDSPEEEAFAKRDDIQEFRAYAVSEACSLLLKRIKLNNNPPMTLKLP